MIHIEVYSKLLVFTLYASSKKPALMTTPPKLQIGTATYETLLLWLMFHFLRMINAATETKRVQLALWLTRIFPAPKHSSFSHLC